MSDKQLLDVRLSEGWEAQPSDRLAQAEYDELPHATSDEAALSEANLMRRVSQLRLAQDEEGSRPSGKCLAARHSQCFSLHAAPTLQFLHTGTWMGMHCAAGMCLPLHALS